MEILKKIDDLLIGWGISPSRADMLDQFIAFALILAVAFLADALCRKILLKVVAQLVKKTKATWDDIVFDRKVMVHLSRMVAPVIIYLFVPLAFVEVGSSAMDFIRRICLIYIIITFLSFVNSFLKAVYSVYSEKEQFRDRPLKGMLQTMQVILWLVGGIVVVGELIGRDPLSLLAGLGASAAILMLVFKDSIMGFVSGIQLSANNMLRVGDWIQMPKYGADGTVIEVTLNTVKVRNWDNTITTIPPYALVSDSFQNWRGMQESGGRRIKRSIRIDMNSVKFCTPEMLAKYKKIQLLKDYIEETEKVIEDYNKEHGITPKTITKSIREAISAVKQEDIGVEFKMEKEEDVKKAIEKLTDQMLEYAANMEFEKAAETRDKIKELRENTGMNRKEFCEYFGIPYRTVTEWERGTRKMPDYVFRLLAYRIKMENFAEKEEVDEE